MRKRQPFTCRTWFISWENQADSRVFFLAPGYYLHHWVSCLRFVYEKGVIHCSFFMAKTRNVPFREWTILGLKLQAAVLAARLSKIILKELDLPVDQSFFWSDSMYPGCQRVFFLVAKWTALACLIAASATHFTAPKNSLAPRVDSMKNEERNMAFSKLCCQPCLWNPQNKFPKTVASHSWCLKPCWWWYFHAECRWQSGPKFLWEPEHTWPNVPVEDLQDDGIEVQKSLTVMFASDAPQIDLLLQCYSSWSSQLKVMKLVLRFVKRVQRETPEYLSQVHLSWWNYSKQVEKLCG